jgi:LysM repeat protein
MRQSRHSQYIDLAAVEARLQAKVASLEAKQRRQRLIEDLEKPKRKGSGFRFIHAFLIVMGLHVVAVGSFYGFSALKKIRNSDKMALNQKPPVYAGVQEPGTPPKVSSETKSPAEVLHKPPQKAPTNTTKTAKKLPPSSKEPSAEIRALFERRHPQKQALVGNSSNAPTLATQEQGGSSRPSFDSLHKVNPGETLAQIAKSHGVRTAEIRNANHLNDSDDLQVGQKLKIPASDPHPPLQLVEKEVDQPSQKVEEPEKFIPKPERIAPNGVYTVQRGDNPYMVARKLGVSFTDLMTANSITNPADVSIGMKLKVPSNKLASN